MNIEKTLQNLTKLNSQEYTNFKGYGTFITRHQLSDIVSKSTKIRCQKIPAQRNTSGTY